MRRRRAKKGRASAERPLVACVGGREVVVVGRRVYASDYFFCFVWKSLRTGKYYVCEERSGLVVSEGETEKDAIQKSFRNVDAPGHKAVRRRLVNAPPVCTCRYNKYQDSAYRQRRVSTAERRALESL